MKVVEKEDIAVAEPQTPASRQLPSLQLIVIRRLRRPSLQLMAAREQLELQLGAQQVGADIVNRLQLSSRPWEKSG